MAARILFLPDIGAEIGGGHVMRSLTLSRALVSGGARVLFVAGEEAGPIIARFGEGVEFRPAGPAADLDAICAAAAHSAGEWGADALVVDHFRLSSPQVAAASGASRTVLMQDLPELQGRADILVDPTPGRTAADHASQASKALTGPRYALVRPEFAALRAEVLARRRLKGPVGRALISLGLTDVGAITSRVLDAVRASLGEIEVDVAIGSAAPSVRGLIDQAWSDRRLHIHVDARDMARLMSRADVCIGAGGSSAWERACLGLPSLTLVLADNQRGASVELEAAGATLLADAGQPRFEERLEAGWLRLVADEDLRASLSRVSSSLCDGLGAERVATEILSLVGE